MDDEIQLYRTTEGALDLTTDMQGMYSFINLDKLWVTPTETLAPMSPLSDQDIRQVADTFLTTHDLMPMDAVYYEVISDTLTEIAIEEVPATQVSALGHTTAYTDILTTISTTVATAQQVVYSRHIVYTPTGSSSITFSVQGPGARLKVYVSNSGEVVGAMGGWRAVDDVGVLDVVEILTPTQMTSLYEQLGDALNLAPIPFRADTITVTHSTVGYYEQPKGVEQTSLTPVYILESTLSDSSTGVTTTAIAFIPAAASMLPPLARITSVTEEFPMVTPGQIITLTAADASQPLSTLGYGKI